MKIIKSDEWKEVEKYLKNHHILYKIFTHPPVYTVKEAEKYEKALPGLGCKSLFLRSEDKTRYFLYTLPGKGRADLKKLARKVGVKRLSFGNETELWLMLKVRPGSISPLSVINDKEGRVEFLLDKRVFEADAVLVHPNDNHASLLLSKEMLNLFLKTLPYGFMVISI